ncbi:CDP-alcohol phosphatidyltransferase family protein [bacterium]|nr:CDP-alcohol phosphatidyltransferase family protein [bacterium]
MDDEMDINSSVIKLDSLPNKLMTVSNILTLTRIFLLPFLIWTLDIRKEFGYTPAIIIGSIMILTDIFDGIIARRYNQYSRLGVILDPVFDKLVIMTLTIYFAAKGEIPTWIAVIVVARDITLLAFGAVMVKRGLAPKPIIWGRLYPLLWGIAFLLLFVGLYSFAWSLMIVAIILGIFSAGAYYNNYRKMMETKK